MLNLRIIYKEILLVLFKTYSQSTQFLLPPLDCPNLSCTISCLNSVLTVTLYLFLPAIQPTPNTVARVLYASARNPAMASCPLTVRPETHSGLTYLLTLLVMCLALSVSVPWFVHFIPAALTFSLFLKYSRRFSGPLQWQFLRPGIICQISTHMANSLNSSSFCSKVISSVRPDLMILFKWVSTLVTFLVCFIGFSFLPLKCWHFPGFRSCPTYFSSLHAISNGSQICIFNLIFFPLYYCFC